ncbi:MAG TPA: hypothetical protein DEA08_04515 [Planctomycetes bacterium]|nr:hypothetical protein [Planctomycetota bacterium]
MAEGTDYSALPFVRIDRTTPEVTSVDVPPILLTVDTYPSEKSEDLVKSEHPPAERGELAPSREDARDYYVRFPWPFGLWQRRGSHKVWSLTAFLLGNNGAPGPVGRGLDSDPEVSKNPFPAFASDPEPGGVNSLPFVFWNHEIDHSDHPGRGDASDRDQDIHLWPFFVYGEGDRPEHDYFALAPFGGTSRSLLGKEQITWFGFPYPLYAKVKDRSYDSHHVLWPFINWVDGERNSGFRVLPFFGHYERTGLKGNKIYERNFVLWPFLTWSTTGLNEEAPTDTFFLFPFYGHIRGPRLGQRTFLWPFFKYTVFLDEKDQEHWELRAPFPFFQVASGPDGRYKFDLWPLFGIKERPGYTRHFVAWPIWRYEHLRGRSKDGKPGRTFTGTWLLPLFWRTHVSDSQGREEHKWRAWPFLHYRSYKDGSLDVGGLTPWWFDDDGWGRTVGRFFTLYRYQRSRDGSSEHDALLGLLSVRSRPAVEGRAEYDRASFLFGAVQFRTLGEEKGLRLLWLLPELTWGGT